MRGSFLITLSILITFPFVNKSYADKKSAKLTEKIEIMYASGQYYEALRKNGSLKNYLAKKFGATKNLEEGYAKIREAKIREALGQYDDIDKFIKEGLFEIESVAGVNSLAYANARLEVAKVYLAMTDFQRARESITALDEVLEQIHTNKKFFEKERDLVLAQVLLEQGFYNEAYQLFESTKVFWFTNIHKEDKVFDLEKGDYIQTKLSKYEYLRRKRLYANCLNFMGHVRLAQGHYRRADSILTKSYDWMMEHKFKKDIAFVDYVYLHGRVYFENDRFKEFLDELEDAEKLAGKTKVIKYRPQGKEYAEILRYYLIALYANDKTGEAKTTKNVYYPKVKHYYQKENIAIAKLEYIEAQRQFALGKDEKALKSVEEALANKAYFPGVNLFEGEFYELAYDIYLENNEVEKALEMRQKYCDLYEKLTGKESPKYHLSLINKAIFLQDYKDKYEVAEKVYKNSFEQIYKPQIYPTNPWYFEIVNSYAKLFQYTDRFEQAKIKLENAVDEAKRFCGSEHYLYAIELRELGELYVAIGKYFEAIDAYKESWTIFRKYKNKHRPEVIETLKAYARLFILIGNYADAEGLLDEAEKVAEKTGQDISIEEFATLYVKKGEYSKVEGLLRESISRKKVQYGDVHRGLISPYKELANLYLITGEYSDAEKMIEKALSISREIYGEESLIYAECLNLQGKVYLELGDYETAEDTDERVLWILGKALGTKEHVKVANAMNELALAKYYNGKSKSEVLEIFEEARGIIKRTLGQKNPAYADALINIALVYIDLEKYADADGLLSEANSIWIKKSKLGKNNVNSAEIYLLKGDVAKKQKRLNDALNYYDDAAGIYENVFGNTHPDYVYARSRAARIYYIKGDYKRSIKALDETTEIYMSHIEKNFSFLSERQKVRFWNKIKTDFEFYNTLAFKYYEEDPDLVENVYNNTMATKGLLLNSTIQLKRAILNSGDPDAVKIYDEWIEKRESYIAMQSLPSDQLKENGIVLESVEKEIEELERKLSSKSEVFAETQKARERSKSISWKDVQDQLGENEYAIEMVKYRYYADEFTDSTIYVGMIVSPETKKRPDFVVFPEGQLMDDNYKKYYRNVMKFKSADKKSYDRFWKNIAEKLTTNSTVYFSPEGVYNEINLEAIPTPDGQYVLDKNNIVILGNTKDLVLKKSEAKKEVQKVAMLIGNPAFYEAKLTNEKVYITKYDSIYATEAHKIFITRSDDKIVGPNQNITIKTEDNIIATLEDNLYIKTEDKIYATLQDSIYITTADSILKSNSTTSHEFFQTSDKVFARIEDRVYITTSDSIRALPRHNKVIRTEEKVRALPRHKKYIDSYDSIYAKKEDKIFITIEDKIINQDFYNSMTVSQLPGAEQEINEINDVLKKNGWNTTKLVYGEATEESIKDQKVSPTYFHIATHGFFNEDDDADVEKLGLSQRRALENPLNRSGLILRGGGDILREHGGIELNAKNGILTANEVMNLDFEEAELVVLSACETGKGEVQVGEGVNGLQRSFLVAGANTIVMSLFKVSDDATRMLMNSFYSELSKTGDKRASFISAKKKVREEYKDPIYWGAFVMIGLD